MRPMRTTWQALVWKEWHEHKWKLVATTTIIVSLTAVSCLFVQEAAASLLVLLTYSIVPLAVFIGAGDAAGEQGRNTLPFLQSLPVRSWQAEFWRAGFGIGCCIIPMIFVLITVGMVYWLLPKQGAALAYELNHWRGDFPMVVQVGHIVADWSLSSGLLASIAGVSVYIWTTAIGANRRSEGHAISVALATIIGCWTLLWVLAIWTLRPSLLLWGATPGGLAMVLVVNSVAPQLAAMTTWAIGMGIAVHALLLAKSIFGQRRISSGRPIAASESSGVWQATARRCPPRRSPWSAIVWKQLRESGPIAAVGAAAILFFLCANVIFNGNYYLGEHKYLMAELHASLTAQIGFLVVLVVGIGLFDQDLGPKLHSFWRSRPINPDLWFWTKYLVGLAVLIVALGLPVMISGAWYSWETGWGRQIPTSLGPQLNMFVMIISILLAIYALAIATICLVRVTLYAAVLSVGVIASGVCASWYYFGEIDRQRSITDWIDAIAVMCAMVAILATVAGWWAVRRDVGWKNS